MNPPPAILSPTDFSAPARRAVERAARLAAEQGAPLALLHVLPGDALDQLRRWLGADSPAAARLHEQATQELAALAAAVAAPPAGLRLAVREGAVPEEVDREAREAGAGLVVFGARGAGALRRFVLGSHAERLARRSACPALVVRRAPDAPYRRVLLALDAAPGAEALAALARRVAPQAHVVCAQVYDVPFAEKLRFAGVAPGVVGLYRDEARAEATHRVHALAAAAGLGAGDWTPYVLEGDAAERLAALEAEQGCDLVVLGKRGRSAAEDLLLGSVTRHLLAEGGADVLLAPLP